MAPSATGSVETVSFEAWKEGGAKLAHSINTLTYHHNGLSPLLVVGGNASGLENRVLHNLRLLSFCLASSSPSLVVFVLL